MSDKRFPVLDALDSFHRPMTIPWGIAEEAWIEYDQRFGTGQSLERIAERGGFSVGELTTFLNDRIQKLKVKQP